MTEGYASGIELRENIIAIICEWWKRVKEGEETTNYLLSATIYERLISEGGEVTDRALSTALAELATLGQITVTLAGGGAPERARAHGGMTIHNVMNPDLCP